MATTAFNVIQIVVNNQPIGIIPNSFKFTDGKGERNVRTKMSGSDTQVIVSTDVSTFISMCSFDLILEADTPALVIGWRVLLDNNVVVAADTESGKTYTFNQAIITNNLSFEAGVDGTVSIEFESQSVIQG